MRHIGTQPIETERLLLRRFRPSDAPAMYENWANDPEVTRFLRWEPHKDVEETRQVVASIVESYQNDETYYWAIERKEDGALMGAMGVFYASEAEGPKGWEPAYCLGRAFWNKGYASEALAGVLRYFTEGTGIDTLHCCHAAANPASGKVLLRNGFTHTHDGEYHKLDGSAVKAHYYSYQKDDTCPKRE